MMAMRVHENVTTKRAPLVVALERLRAGDLLSVQAAYLLVPVEERADACCRRIDEISAEVAGRCSP